MGADQIAPYQNKLQYEIDSWDLYQALENKENTCPTTALDTQCGCGQ